MKIKFYVVGTGVEAELSEEGTQFFIDAEGHVVEFIEQSYANFYAHNVRDDLYFEIEEH